MDWSPFLPAGGVNLELLTRLSVLEQEVAAIKETRATEASYGLARLSNATDITETNNGLAIPASQNNAGITGSLRNVAASAQSTASSAMSNAQGNSQEIQNIKAQLPTKRNYGYIYVVYGFMVAENFLSTTSIPAPEQGYGVTITGIDIYGLRRLSESEKNAFSTQNNFGSFRVTTNNGNLARDAHQRILVVEYRFT